MVKWEYIISGCTYFRLNFKEVQDDIQLQEWFKDIFNCIQGKNAHSYGLLSNAFTEKHLGKIIHSIFRDNISNAYADSGGLQIITRGLQASEDTKDQIYQHQAQYSDIGMCFDEIPLKFSGEKSQRLDRSGRWFDIDILEERARSTGRNINRQIEVYLDEKSNTRPCAIIQGNCLETYQQWCDFMLKEIPQDRHKYIGGVALGSAAFGVGDLEEITKAFIFTTLPIYETTHHLHLLGVGSAARLIPYIIANQSGLYKDELKISYDSTTHSSSLHFGRFTNKEAKFIQLPKHFDIQMYKMVYDEVKEYFPQIENDLTMEEWYDGIVLNGTDFIAKYGSRVKTIKAGFYWVIASVLNFSHVINKMNNKKYLLGRVDRKQYSIYNSLYNIKTEDDFKRWEREVGRFLTSKRINKSPPSNLLEFI